MASKAQTLRERIKYVGVKLYGENWPSKLAAGLGLSRSQLFEWRVGSTKTTRRDVDSELIALVERERGAADARRLMLSRLRTALLRMTGREDA